MGRVGSQRGNLSCVSALAPDCRIFSEKFTLNFHALLSTPLQIYTQSTFVSRRLRRHRAQRRSVESPESPVRVDSCAKIPQLRSQLGRTGKNFRCRWLKIPLAHFMGCPCLQHTEFPVAAQQSTRANTHAQWYVSHTRLQDVSVI